MPIELPTETELKQKAARMLKSLPETDRQSGFGEYNANRLGLGVFVDQRDPLLLGLRERGIVRFVLEGSAQRSIEFNPVEAQKFAGEELKKMSVEAIRS